MSAWYWGRIHHGAYCVDCAWVFPRDPEMPIFSPLLIARGSEIILSTNLMNTELSPFEKDPKIGQEYANIVTVGFCRVKQITARDDFHVSQLSRDERYV